MVKPRIWLQVDGEWIEAEGDGGFYTRDGLSISRGYANENGSLKPGSAEFTLKNHDLRYDGDNPLSPYFEKIGQNTPFIVGLNPIFALWNGDNDPAASTPDSVALSITGDIDIRCEHAHVEAAAAGPVKSGSYALHPSDGAGHLNLLWVDSGALVHDVVSTTDVEVGNHIAYRATLDVDNGAGGHTVTFYTAETIDGPWTQLEAPQTFVGTTDIVNTAGALTVGDGSAALNVGIIACEVRSGINGTAVANPRFAEQAAGTTSFADAAGNTWTVDNAAFIGDELHSLRFYGELTSAENDRDTSDSDQYMQALVSGITQRLTQGGGSPVGTALESWVPTQTDASFHADGYWPLNEGAGSTQGAPVVGTFPIVLTRSLSPNARFGRGDFSLPWLEKGLALYQSDILRGEVAMATGQDSWEFDFVYSCKDGGDTTVTMHTIGANNIQWTWQVRIEPASQRFVIVQPLGTTATISTTAWLFDPFDGTGRLFTFRARPSGSNTIATLGISSNYPGTAVVGNNGIIDNGSQTTFTDPIGTAAPGRLDWFTFEHVGLDEKEPFALAHVAAFSCSGTTDIYDIEVPASGMHGEEAHVRMNRLVVSKGFDEVFDPAWESFYDTELMGPQEPGDLVGRLEECAKADGGFIFETRDTLGYSYASPLGSDIGNDDATLVLDYSAEQVAPPFKPVRDDQRIVNDVTAKREGGGSYRFQQTLGRYKVSDPADGGVGRYPQSVTVNVATDTQLGDVAAWAVHLGTWDERRYPTVTVILDALDDATRADALSVDIGDRIKITNLRALGIYDDVLLKVLGYDERWDEATHRITFNCVPAHAYNTVYLNLYDDKLNSGSSTTDGAFTSGTDTSMSVATTGAELWTTTGAQYPLNIKVAGVVLEVTAVSGASSPQTFTVTQTPVNGVNKVIPVGSPVKLQYPSTLARQRGLI